MRTPCSTTSAGSHQSALREAFTCHFSLAEDKQGIGEGGEGERKQAEPPLSGTENKNVPFVETFPKGTSTHQHG